MQESESILYFQLISLLWKIEKTNQQHFGKFLFHFVEVAVGNDFT
jgi:hypothetical protein